MRALLGLAVFFAATAIFLAGLFDDSEQLSPIPEVADIGDIQELPSSELRQLAEQGIELPAINGYEQDFSVRIPRQTDSTGTAFAINEQGYWLTARHVTDGCSRLGLLTAPRKVVEAGVERVHPRADLAVIKSLSSHWPIAHSQANLTLQQKGFHFGFPQGQPGEVHSQLIGRKRMRLSGRYATSEPVIAWSELVRNPDTTSLGGLSGGPTLDVLGRVIGVTVASTVRRGRVYTAAPTSLRQVLQQASLQAHNQPELEINIEKLNQQAFVDYGQALRKRFSLAKVICLVERKHRKRSLRTF